MFDPLISAAPQEFNTDINVGYHTNTQDLQSSLVSDVLGGATATVVDAAASIWNSLPGTTEVATHDLLSGISDNALRVYEEHPDTISTASFIAGSFIPGGLALKGMNAMRAGSKAVSWFSKAGKEADLAKVAKLFEEGAGATTEYRSAVRGMFAKTALNQALDAVAMEVAVVGALNSHPFVEDYMKDPVTNFGISVVMGGVIGGALGAIADNHAVKEATGGIYAKVMDSITDRLLPRNPTAPNIANFLSANTNMSSLDAMIEAGTRNGRTITNDLTLDVATKLRAQYAAEANDIFESSISADLKNLPIATKEIIKTKLASSPEMFGVESIRSVGQSDLKVTNIVSMDKDGVLVAKPNLSTSVSNLGPIQPKMVESVYFPETGLYGTREDIKHLAGAGVLDKTPEQLAKALPWNYSRLPNMDSSFELMGISSADAQGKYIAAMERVDKMSVNEIKNMKISETDGPLMNALIARMAKDPEIGNLSISTFDKSPVYKSILETKTEQLIKEGKITATGPTSSYEKAVDAFAGNGNIDAYRPKGDVSVDASRMLQSWISGAGVGKMRKAATDFFAQQNGGFGKVVAGSESGLAAKQFGELYESAQSVALRSKFRTLADANGDVYLYRGSKSAVQSGHAPIESYTTHASKAASFGTTRLYKVNVDDILMGFEDIGSGAHNAEILVRAPARAEEATLDSAGKLKFRQSQEGAINGTTTTTTTERTVVEGATSRSMSDMKNALMAQKQEAIDTLLASGTPIEAVALKTNTDSRIILQYATTPERTLDTLRNLVGDYGGHVGNPLGNIVNSTADFEKILAKEAQPLILKGNMRKNAYSAAMGALDNRSLATINSEITAATMYASDNAFVRKAADFMFDTGSNPNSVRYHLDILRAELSKGNNAFAGNAFVNSFDFFTRNMGSLGPMISNIGRRWEHTRNEFIEHINKPLAEAMTKISVDRAAVIEFNTFREVNAGVGGWRSFRQDANTGDWNLVTKALKKDADGKDVEVLEAVLFQGKPYKVVSESVIAAIKQMETSSPELLSLANTNRRIQGMPDVHDIGLWIPSFNPINKHVAYVYGTDDSTKILWANTKAEHAQIIKDYREKIAATGSSERVIEKGVDQAEWSRLNGRLDTMHMTVADSSAKKSGSSASAIVRTDTQVFGEIAGGYEHYINSQMRTLADLSMSDVTDMLGKMSALNRGSFDSQPLGVVKKIVDAPKDAAATLKNTLLGNPNLGEYEGWKSVNQSFETGLSFALNSAVGIWNATLKPITSTLLGSKKGITAETMAKVDYETVMKDMKAKGIEIWDGFDTAVARERGFAKLEDSPDISKRLIYASNALAATMMLRVGELAQPLVNMMSLPILTSLAVANKMPESFMGIAKQTANVSPTQIMFEGMRASHAPQFSHFSAVWEKAGYFDSIISESNKTLQSARSMNKGLIAGTEKAIDSNMVKWLSKPADVSETIVRRQTMFTGAVLAKRLYPELDDAGVTIFARDFMDKAVGNFQASQRPVFFQGTLGVALGLFQTYSVTLMQGMYRQLELKQYRQLGKAMLAQSGIFGASSMPGFNPVSQMIGEHFSDNHMDLNSGTFRAVPDSAANAILYGLPSLAGTGIQTRGDSNFRAPGIGGDNIVAINVAKQITQAIGTVAGAMGQGSSAGSAMMQALSLQNVSRPLARGAELATGYSVTRQGNTVQTPEEVWTTTGIMSRVLGVRPLEETKLRETMHLNTYYGSIDRENRQNLVKKIKNSMRAGTFEQDDLSAYTEEYMRHGGSPTGFRSAISTALAQVDTTGKETLVQKLKPDSPFMYMMNGMDGR